MGGVRVHLTETGSGAGIDATTPAHLSVPAGMYRAHVVGVPAGYRLVSGEDDTVDLTDNGNHLQFILERVTAGNGAGPVARDPGGRTPLSSIPSGPVNQP
ncbi:hypothetical protein ACLQ3C_01560 [Gordonia sp. DT30]|uniref:hypothetical protein n=1 Tax=unclassified Gordonia (in: high G+C Gram-positive bacteria) TaxID=2657482 RepID=UPI003CEFFE06